MIPPGLRVPPIFVEVAPRHVAPPTPPINRIALFNPTREQIVKTLEALPETFVFVFGTTTRAEFDRYYSDPPLSPYLLNAVFLGEIGECYWEEAIANVMLNSIKMYPERFGTAASVSVKLKVKP